MIPTHRLDYDPVTDTLVVHVRLGMEPVGRHEHMDHGLVVETGRDGMPIRHIIANASLNTTAVAAALALVRRSENGWQAPTGSPVLNAAVAQAA